MTTESSKWEDLAHGNPRPYKQARRRAWSPQRGTAPCFGVPARVAVGLATVVGLMVGAVGVGSTAVVAAGGVSLLVGARLDAWQRGLVGLLAALTLAPTIEGFAPLVSALRFPGAALLLTYTCIRYRRLLSSTRPRNIQRVFLVTLLVFTAYSAGSMVWSASPHITARYLVASIAVVGVPVAASLSRWRDDRLVWRDLNVVYWFVVTFATLGILDPQAMQHSSARASGIFANPNSLAAFAVLGFALGLGLVRITRYRPLFFASQTALTLVIVSTQTRAAAAAILIAVLWISIHSTRREQLRIAVSAVVVVAPTIAVFAWFSLQPPETIADLVARFNPSATSSDTSYLSGREMGWQASLAVWQEKPLLGHGFRTGEHLFQLRREAHESVWYNDTTHNGFLQILIELGVIGLTLLITAIFYVMRARPPRAMLTRALWLSCTAAAAAGISIQVVESSIVGVGGPFALLLWTALAAAARLGASSHGPVTSRRPRPFSVSADIA